MRDDARLARAGSREDQQRPVGVSYSFLLLSGLREERKIQTLLYSTVTLFARFRG